MDAERCDDLARVWFSTPSRRGIVGAAVGLVLNAFAGRAGVRAQANCPSGTVRCGGPGGLPTAECCPFGEDCCVSTGVCCGPNATCFRLPDGDICRPKCQPNAFRCAGGAGECCPAGQKCCGAGFRICCGPNEECERPGNDGTPFCRVSCPIGQSQCSGVGDCCTPFLQHCCGPRCCGGTDECVIVDGEHRCAPICLPSHRRCGSTCCPPGRVCVRSTCARKRKKKRKKRH